MRAVCYPFALNFNPTMLAFVCTHVANGEDVWQLTRTDATPGMERHVDATCRICTGLPESSFTADDVVMLDTSHLEEPIERMLHNLS